VDAAGDRFCCSGCELAYEIIHGAGLERYYDERTQYAPRPEPVAGGWSAVPVETLPDGTCEARLMVEGLRCGSCVWVVEHVVEATPGVTHAHVSYATGRATFRWDPSVTALPAIASRISTLGYSPRALGEETRPDRGLILRLGIAAFAAMNVMLLHASIYTGWIDVMEDRYLQLFRWTSLVLMTPVAIWCASPFFAGAVGGLRNRVLHMDVPIALGVIILYGHGVIATLMNHETYLDSLGMLVALLLAGRMLEQRGRRRAAEAAVSLAASVPHAARRITDSGVETVPSSELRTGDTLEVGAGEELAADGIVVSGCGLLRRALLTGEAEPVAIEWGDHVEAGTVLLDGNVRVRVLAVGKETVLSRMASQLQEAADRESLPTAADRIAPMFTAATLVVAAIVFAAWFAFAGLGRAVPVTVAVLVVACPCALALSHPLAAAAGLGAAARRGLLFRSTDALLTLNDIDTVALDKTGTVTEGVLAVTQSDDATLRVAAGLERHSIHPIARAIVAEAARRGIPLPHATQVRETPGVGMDGVVDGVHWRLRTGGPGTVVLQALSASAGAQSLLAPAGAQSWPASAGALPPLSEPAAGPQPWTESEHGHGGGNAHVNYEGDIGAGTGDGVSRTPVQRRGRAALLPGGRILLSDAVRNDARTTIAELQRRGLDVILISGDNRRAAARMAEAAGIDTVAAEVTPEGKAAWVRQKREGGGRILVAGDGLNDGPALAAADVGVAMANGAASSVLVADGVISSPALAPLLSGFRAARACRTIIEGNLRRSLIYNVAAVAAAAAGLINPLIAAVLMPLSSGIVIYGAYRVEEMVAAEETMAQQPLAASGAS
jgi:P-type Cu2+ transporter